MTGMGARGATVTGRVGSDGPRRAAELRQSRGAVRLPGQTTPATWGWQASHTDVYCASTLLDGARLQPIQPRVETPVREELVMGASLADPPVV
jgi:hypothetical protein